MLWTYFNKLFGLLWVKIFIKWRMFGWMSFWLFSFWKPMSMYFIFNFFLNFFQESFILQKIVIDCNFPCLNCIGEGTNCLSCIESFSLNGTTCISDSECLLGGYIENGTCFGSLSFLFFFFMINNYVNRM